MTTTPAPAAVTQIWESPQATLAGSKLRVARNETGYVAVFFLRRTLLTPPAGSPPQASEYITWQIGFVPPLGVNEVARALQALCGVYDHELVQHIGPLLTALVEQTPLLTPDPGVAPQGATMN